MSVFHMRQYLYKAPKYCQTVRGAETWKQKVKAMHDNQVIAVYYRMLRAGELK